MQVLSSVPDCFSYAFDYGLASKAGFLGLPVKIRDGVIIKARLRVEGVYVYVWFRLRETSGG